MSVYRLIAAESLEETIYQRQIYKQQISNIALKASHEKRYFQGVQGVKGEVLTSFFSSKGCVDVFPPLSLSFSLTHTLARSLPPFLPPSLPLSPLSSPPLSLLNARC